jgi:hypothetical protein
VLAELAAARGHLAAVQRRQKEIMESLIAGYRCEEWKAELLTLDARKVELTAMLAAAPLPFSAPKDGRPLSGESDDARRRLGA